MLVFALVFWYGGQLLFRREYTVLQFFIVYSAIINGAQAAGSIFSFAPDMGEAKDAAKLLKSFLNRIPKIDHWSQDGKKIDRLVGKVELQDVRFTYPGRPDHRVLRGVNLTAEPGQFIALVGASGSGKSTVMQLLERFYDPTSGAVLVDEVPLTDYNLQDYRSQLAIVSQETTLYTGTIRENILADKEDLGDDIVIQACKDANIYDFITSLPDGFNTLVGAKGALLSGGQVSSFLSFHLLAQQLLTLSSANVWQSPVPSFATPKSSFLTKLLLLSTPHPSGLYKTPLTPPRRAVLQSPSHID